MQRIHNAFTAALASFADARDLPVAWANEKFVPPLGPHLRPVLRPDPPVIPCLGPGAYIRHSGVCAVQVAVLAGSGEADALAVAGELVKTFRRGLSLGLDGLTLKQGGASAGEIKDGRYTITVALPYYAYLQEEN